MNTSIQEVVLVGLPDDALIDVRAVCALNGKGRAKLHDDVRRGLHPAPVIRQPRYTRWRLGDVLAHLRQQIAQAATTNATTLLVERARAASDASRTARANRSGGATAGGGDTVTHPQGGRP